MTGRCQAYPEYKYSGVEWLGDIPQHWSVWKLNHFAPIITCGVAATPEYVDDGVIFLSAQNIKNRRVDLSKGFKYISQKLHESLTKNRTPIKGDILLSRVGTVGEVCIVDVDFKFSIFVSLTHLRLNQDICTNRFFVVLFQAAYTKALHGAVTLVGGGVGNLNVNDLRVYSLPIPSHDEQEKIANFLDHETAKIDTLIEKQQQLIKLLKEKRQAVISHAVTKGLTNLPGANLNAEGGPKGEGMESPSSPNAPMRDSGVEWLGEVPEHWDVVPLKHLCSLLKDGTHLPPPRVDSGVPLMSVRNIIDGKFVFRDDDSNISEADYQDLCRSFVPQVGDVLLAIVGGTIGKVAIIEEMTKFHIQRSLAIFRVRKNILTCESLANIIGSSNFQSLLWENVGFSAQPGIYLGALANFRLPVPPLEEQNTINEYCALKSERIDALISKATSAIELIKERRTALISAAVTGKIDVRNWVAPAHPCARDIGASIHVTTPIDSKPRGNDRITGRTT